MLELKKGMWMKGEKEASRRKYLYVGSRFEEDKLATKNPEAKTLVQISSSDFYRDASTVRPN